jgi:hypothetical protein
MEVLGFGKKRMNISLFFCLVNREWTSLGKKEEKGLDLSFSGKRIEVPLSGRRPNIVMSIFCGFRK